MSTIKYPTYFLEKDLYEAVNSSAVRKSPLNALDKDEWLDILHYLKGRESAGILRKGLTSDHLKISSYNYFFYAIAREYLTEKWTKLNNRNPIIPEREYDLFSKVRDLIVDISEKYETISVDVDRGTKPYYDLKLKE